MGLQRTEQDTDCPLLMGFVESAKINLAESIDICGAGHRPTTSAWATDRIRHKTIYHYLS